MSYKTLFLVSVLVGACSFDRTGFERGTDEDDETAPGADAGNTGGDGGADDEPRRLCGDGVCEAAESCGICSDDCGGCTTGVVSPMYETVTVAPGDAHDPAVWIDRDDPTRSLILGTDEDSDGGLHVYDLSGNELDVVGDGGALYNVDVRGDVVVAGNRSRDRIEVYRVDPGTRTLTDATVGSLDVGFGAYGACMYRSPGGTLYVFVTSSHGEVEQWRLDDAGDGRYGADLVRALDVGSKTEGCVADDDTGALYLAEEYVGIWRYGAEPGDGDDRVLVDAVGERLEEVEGLALYRARAGAPAGYLIASSQARDEFVVYRRDADNEYLATFSVVEGGPFDGCENTTGIEIVNLPLGGPFAHGAFVAADERDDTGSTNFKVVPWDAIAEATGGLMIE